MIRSFKAYSVFVFLAPMFLLFACTERLSLEEQIKTLESCGITLNEGIYLDDLLAMEKRRTMERRPFEVLYPLLGETVEREPWMPISNQCWNLEMEFIVDTGDYVYILENFMRISQGELKFENLRDVIDDRQKKASVSFTLNGDVHHWDLVYNNDWVDPDLLSRLVALTEEYSTKGKYTYYGDGTIGWATLRELQILKERTGLDIEFME